MYLKVRLKGESGEVEIEHKCERSWNGDFYAALKDKTIDDAIKCYKGMSHDYVTEAATKGTRG